MRAIPVVLAAVLAACAPRARAVAAEVPARWGPYELDLVDEAGRALPTFEHRGRTHVLGALGGRYLLRFRNGSGHRVEIVASVDGRDVVDGRPAELRKRGYVVAPYGEVTIDGYRLDEASVAAFRFSSVPRSYAARQGDARDVGVVGVAVFEERPLRHDRPRALAEPRPPGDLAGGPPAADGERRAESAPAPGPGEVPPSARGPAPEEGRSTRRRPGLGTEFGEERASPVERVAFVRAAATPQAVLTLRYDDRAGLAALGIDVDGGRWARAGELRLRERATPFRRDGYCEPPAGWSGR